MPGRAGQVGRWGRFSLVSSFRALSHVAVPPLSNTFRRPCCAWSRTLAATAARVSCWPRAPPRARWCRPWSRVEWWRRSGLRGESKRRRACARRGSGTSRALCCRSGVSVQRAWHRVPAAGVLLLLLLLFALPHSGHAHVPHHISPCPRIVQSPRWSRPYRDGPAPSLTLTFTNFFH